MMQWDPRVMRAAKATQHKITGEYAASGRLHHRSRNLNFKESAIQNAINTDIQVGTTKTITLQRLKDVSVWKNNNQPRAEEELVLLPCRNDTDECHCTEKYCRL